jgi:hypothetical protein
MAEKQKKSEVHYRVGTETRRCGLCTMFVAGRGQGEPNTCTAVRGDIDTRDVCDLFEARRRPAA